MKKTFYLATGRANKTTDFLVVILLGESVLIRQKLVLLGPGDFTLEEKVITERHQIADFIEKRQLECYRWEAIKEKDFLPYQAAWQGMKASLAEGMLVAQPAAA